MEPALPKTDHGARLKPFPQLLFQVMSWNGDRCLAVSPCEGFNLEYLPYACLHWPTSFCTGLFGSSMGPVIVSPSDYVSSTRTLVQPFTKG